jgi:hypothetical protein
MKLSSKSTQEAFARSPWLKLGSLVGACLLLIAAALGVWRAFSLPASTEQSVALVNYEHRGEFDYSVYLKPNSLYGPLQPQEEVAEEETVPVFFRKIIDEAWLAFSYNFSCGQPLSTITSEVVVSAIAENPDMWQKEIAILEDTHGGQHVSVEFPLDLESLESVVDEIEDEIGVRGVGNQFVIRAAVHTTAVTALGQIIEDDFSHEITVAVQAYTFKLEGSLERSDAGSGDGISYSQKGRFDYEVYLKPNSLYDTDVLSSEAPPAAESPPATESPPAAPLGPGLTYFRKIVDNIMASFSYQFLSDKPVTNLVEEVEVTAVLRYPEMWTKSFTLVPKTSYSGPLLVDFPVDIEAFQTFTDNLRTELGLGAASYDLAIQATVHTTGDTESGPIDKTFAHSLQGQLGTTTFTLAGSLTKQQPGAIMENRMVPVANTWVFRILSLVGLVLVVFALLFVLRNSRQAQAVAISGMEEEALRTKRKHRGVIVDVVELPPAGAGESVIPIGSVDELVGIADALLKPVLHHAGTNKHTYCVIDGGVRYLHVVQAQE